MHEPHGDFDSHLHALADEARRQEAIAARRRKADRRVSAALSGTFAGTLTELAEAGSVVSILTRVGSAIRGQIIALGPEVLVVRTGDQNRVALRTSAIEGVRESGSGHDRTVDEITSGADLAQILDAQAHDRRRVSFTMSSGNHIMGQINRVGLDQVVVTLDGDGETMTVPLFAIDQVVIER